MARQLSGLSSRVIDGVYVSGTRTSGVERACVRPIWRGSPGAPGTAGTPGLPLSRNWTRVVSGQKVGPKIETAPTRNSRVRSQDYCDIFDWKNKSVW